MHGLLEAEVRFEGRALAGCIVEHEAVAVGRKDERHLEDFGVPERLLHPVTDGMGVVLGLDESDRHVRLVVENEVSLKMKSPSHIVQIERVAWQ